MATSDPRDVRRIPANLCSGCSDLTTDFPHGGTALGITRGRIFEPRAKYTREICEEFGGATRTAYYTGENPVLMVVLRSWDDDALSLVWPLSATGSSGHIVVKSNVKTNATRPGKELTGSVLALSPHAVDRDPMLLIYNAIPMIAETAELQFSTGSELGMALVWECAPNSDGNSYAFGLRGDLSL